ncbi:metal ABC transporter substrate-binding protein [Schaalia suimastitidis]|uniref:metal ABC transporter substrate-binding protein n=1 Tax=Schaalia suimastitidis TaxID=121163 RepID=UPI000407F378|nr:metal ABC transporter substrate-binding protein [Schaalia suimastitidis]
MRYIHAAFLALAATLVFPLAACDGGAVTTSDKPSIVVTTNILGDVVTQTVGDQATVTTLMPANSDPHSFSISAQQALAMREADLLVANGLGLEEGLLQHIEAAQASGTPTFIAGDVITPMEYTSDDASGPDPHFWTDPTMMITVINALEARLSAGIDGIDPTRLAASATQYRDQLTALDEQMSQRFAALGSDKRKLVTNHHVFGYLARRYDFEIIGAVIPGGATLASPSASDLADLAEAVKASGVRAVFADAAQSDRLVTAVAQYTGLSIEVVPLFTESLSDPDGQAPTYLDMLNVNTQRITDALGT